MSKLSLDLSPTPAVSKPDARAIWREGFPMARRMIRAGTRHGSGDMYAFYLVAARARFGDAGFPVARAAAKCTMARLHVSRAATGTRDELARQGMLSRAVRLDPAPYGGWTWAWTFDPLASPNTSRGLRAQRAASLRVERAHRREVALGLAADRRALEAGRFYTITTKGEAALREAYQLALPLG